MIEVISKCRGDFERGFNSSLYQHWRRIFVLLTASILSSWIVVGQDIEETTNFIQSRIAEDPIQLAGGINSFLGYNYIGGSEQRIDPFRWRVIGFVQADVLGIKIPASVIFNTRSTVFNYTLPAFAFAGLSPSYKWVKLHLGDRNLHFSKYSLSGHSFRGIGVEMTPGKFRLKAMYGRLRRARVQEIGKVQNVEPAYKRLGWGIQTGFVNNDDELMLTLFGAWDDRSSISTPFENGDIRPGENVVITLAGKKSLGKVIKISSEIARSALTSNVETPLRSSHHASIDLTLVRPHLSTGYYWAMTTKLDFHTSFGNLFAAHEWIDPGYSSMGTLYFNNDVERVSAGWTHRLFNKIQLMGSLGHERNNLSGFEVNTYKRWVGNLQISYQIRNGTSLTATYSNFSSTNRLSLLNNPLSPIDTVVLALVNRQAGGVLTYKPSGESRSQFQVNFHWQEANQIENDVPQSDLTNEFILINGSYTWNAPTLHWAARLGMIYQQSALPSSIRSNWGPFITAHLVDPKSKISASSQFHWLIATQEKVSSGSVITIGANATYTMSRRHQVGFDLSFIRRASRFSNSVGFTEVRSSIRYGLKF